MSVMCGAICPCGPNKEPIACAYPPTPSGEPMHAHSWATLPTFTAQGEGIDLTALIQAAETVERGALGVERRWLFGRYVDEYARARESQR